MIHTRSIKPDTNQGAIKMAGPRRTSMGSLVTWYFASSVKTCHRKFMDKEIFTMLILTPTQSVSMLQFKLKLPFLTAAQLCILKKKKRKKEETLI